ncbi:Muskelin N-terminus-domain-containing protein [Daedaleopsis nitida]|nr:Muskelin N-terminus-domain-containing protein [Daedaleopsis nitida]
MNDNLPEPDVAPVEYEIAGSSEHSGAYVPENILVDRPRDQSSRWSGAIATSNTKQWIRLRLKQLCVLKSITFGKVTHPCNTKEVKVLVGFSENNMTEVLHVSLKNDATPETFSIKSTNRVGMPYPTRFVEVVPLSAHGQSFNTSIWHISLSAMTDETYVEHIRLKHEEYRENVALRQIMKHLRQRRFLTPVNHILSRVGVQLEHPLITALHEAFVLQGNWPDAEKLIKDCADAGLLSSYRHACQPCMRWSRIQGLDADGDIPCRRGGHAMCIDEQNGLIYLFGGWDGQRSLDDFWVYDIAKDAWRLLSLATSREKNGPGPRACHKMVFDSKTGSIYVLGRLGDGDGVEGHRARSHVHSELRDAAGTLPWAAPVVIPGAGAPEPSHGGPLGSWPPHSSMSSEFYRYHTRGLDAGKWDLLSFDTASSGGPPLISDHQMALDHEAQVIYVSGGRVVDAEWDALRFSGLYSYDIRTSRWKMYNTSDAYASHPFIPPRWGHSMVLDPKLQTLFIFAGQRDERYLADMYAFHIPTNTVTELFSNFTTSGGPDPCFTQRAVIDPEKREIYVICGLTRSKPSGTVVLESEAPYWIYRYDRPELPGKWTQIFPGKEAVPVCPQPRYAHQVVYDPKSGSVYMHGGNAGLGTDDEEPAGEARASSPEEDATDAARAPKEAGAERRLDDFWHLEVVRPAYEEIVRRAVYEIRQQQFREMCEDGSPIKALTFLQTRVSSVVNHEDPEEARIFRSLLSAHLLAAPARSSVSAASSSRPASSLGFGAGGPGTGPSSPSASAPGATAGASSSRASGVGSGPDVGSAALRFDEDPLEAAANAAGASAPPPSPERYRQRTQMFERLLGFVNAEAKQPDESLMEMWSGDGLVI